MTAEILIIEDDPKMLKVIALILDRAGHQTHSATTGREGITLFKRLSVDLVITDIVMPDGDGFETIRFLREVSPDLPVLAISGKGIGRPYASSATLLGAAASLQKPFRADELVAAVTRLLEAPTASEGS